MEPQVLIVFAKLLIAHLLTDFVFQPDGWVNSKKTSVLKSNKLYFHALIAGATTYIILGIWNNWEVPLFITVTHFVVDYLKAKYENNKLNNRKSSNNKNKTDKVIPFIIDQSAHFVVIIISWLWIIKGWEKVIPTVKEYFINSDFWIILAGFILITYPFAKLISILTEYWRKQLSEERKDSLAKAGLYIGIFERLLILIFILLHEYEVIGFLIAAKSILRFSTKDQQEPQKQTEYVLVGTFISFTLTIILGLLMDYFLK